MLNINLKKLGFVPTMFFIGLFVVVAAFSLIPLQAHALTSTGCSNCFSGFGFYYFDSYHVNLDGGGGGGGGCGGDCNPPPRGCVIVDKQTFNTLNQPLSPVAQFTFTIDGGGPVTNDASGFAEFDNVPVGTHTIAEVVPPTWQQVSVVPASGIVNVVSGTNCAHVTFKNKQVIAPQPPACSLTAGPHTLPVGGGTVTVDWSSTNTTNGTWVPGGDNAGTSGHAVFNNITDTTTFKIHFTGPGGSVDCEDTVTVPPPPHACIQILKETYDSHNNPITPVAPFTFTLDGGATTQNDSAGNAIFNNVTPGNHQITETLPSGWTQLSVTPVNGNVHVVAGETCAAVVFKNKQTDTPPPPPLSCGLDVALVLDSSGSITPTGLTQMKNAFHSFVNTLSPATPTWFSVTDFDNIAHVLQQFTSNVSLVNTAINTPVSNGSTNWEQGLAEAFGTYDPRPTIPNVIIFASDGNPNKHGNPAVGPGTGSDAASLNAAITEANAIKAAGTRIITLGVGPQLTPANLQAISSPGDYYPVADFSSLNSTLSGLATAMCGGTITVHKVIDQDGNLSTTNDQTPGEGWDFTIAGHHKTTDANGATASVDVTAGTYSVSETAQNGYTLVGATCTGAANNGSLSGNAITGIQTNSSSIVSCTFYNKPVSQNDVACTLTANPDTFNAPGGTTTLTWTTSNATSFTIDHNIGGVTPVAGGHVNDNVTTDTTYTGTAVGPHGTATCTAHVTVTPPPGPACTLTINKSEINTGESVKVSWTSSNVTSGVITPQVGTVSPVSSGTSDDIFPPSDTTYTGVFTGPNGTVTCTTQVRVHTGGCQGSCGGGGYNPPNVVLFQKPGESPLASVFLSQIPYTGFEAGQTLTFLFWMAVALFSAIVAYYIVGKGSLEFVYSRIASMAGVPRGTTVYEFQKEEPSYDDTYTPPHPAVEEMEKTPVAMSAVAAPAPKVVMTPATAYAPSEPSGIPEIENVIESRAHAAGILMSPESVHLAANLSKDRAEALRVFGGILNEAVKTLPREDGWIMLTSDRFEKLAGLMPAPAVPAAIAPAPVSTEVSVASLDEASALAFAHAVLKNDRETAFAIIRSFEHDSVNPTSLITGVATVLDRLYRVRQGGKNGIDVSLMDAAAGLSDEKLHTLVETFTHALDTVYANPFTGIKLALGQAFELVSA